MCLNILDQMDKNVAQIVNDFNLIDIKFVAQNAARMKNRNHNWNHTRIIHKNLDEHLLTMMISIKISSSNNLHLKYMLLFIIQPQI